MFGKIKEEKKRIAFSDITLEEWQSKTKAERLDSCFDKMSFTSANTGFVASVPAIAFLAVKLYDEYKESFADKPKTEVEK